MDIAVISPLYDCIFAYTRPMAILANFLTDDVGLKDISPIVDWVSNDNYKAMTLNYSYIKKSNENIIIYFLYDGYELEEAEKRKRFKIKKIDLIDILAQWEKAIKIKKRSKIVIKKENDKIHVKRHW